MRYMRYFVILAGLLLSLASCETSHAVDDAKPSSIDSVKTDSVDARSFYDIPEKKKTVNKIWNG